MKSLAERQASRISGKAEDCVMHGKPFDMSRSGIGKIDRRYLPADEAAAINAATDKAIAETAQRFSAVVEDRVEQPASAPHQESFYKMKVM